MKGRVVLRATDAEFTGPSGEGGITEAQRLDTFLAEPRVTPSPCFPTREERAASARKECRILIAGFGRFPGTPSNPSIALIAALERCRRPALAGVRLATHVFTTRYAAVDEQLPALIARERPDAVALFGVAARAKRLRVEWMARNRASMLFPDAGGAKPDRPTIAPGGPASRTGRFPLQALLAACRRAGVRATASRHAGTYVCNYAYWRALEAAERPGGPRVVLFVHIPRPAGAPPRPRRQDREVTRPRLNAGLIESSARIMSLYRRGKAPASDLIGERRGASGASRPLATLDFSCGMRKRSSSSHKERKRACRHTRACVSLRALARAAEAILVAVRAAARE